jgi:hypothetical protein
MRVLQYRNDTLQAVFDRFSLPQAAQTLLALQWPDFMLPPQELSFFAWVMLFTGYQGGAYLYDGLHEGAVRSAKAVADKIGPASEEWVPSNPAGSSPP